MTEEMTSIPEGPLGKGVELVEEGGDEGGVDGEADQLDAQDEEP